MPMSSSDCSSLAAITLSDVKRRFTQWRETRQKRGKIPDDLWDSVRQLTKQYGCTQIAKELRLNVTQMRSSLQKEHAYHQKDKGFNDLERAEFVIAELPAVVTCTAAPQLPTLELSRPNGAVLKVIGLGHQETHALVKCFLD